MWLAALVIAVFLGYCCVRLWLPGGGRSAWTAVLHGSLGAGLGIGLTSCLYLLLLISAAGLCPTLTRAPTCSNALLTLRRFPRP